MNEEFDIVPVAEDNFYREDRNVSVTDYIMGIDNILNEIEKTGDMEIGLDVAKSLISSAVAHGKALAKLLHGMKQLWNSEKDFTEYVSEFVHIKPLMIDRYVNAWEAYEQIPDQYKEKFLLRPIKDLNALGAAVAQGYEIEDWEKLSNTSGNNEFLKVIREDVKKAPARKNSLTIFLEESGDLIAWMGDTRVNIGYLNIQEVEENPILMKAITRIVSSAGIINRS